MPWNKSNIKSDENNNANSHIKPISTAHIKPKKIKYFREPLLDWRVNKINSNQTNKDSPKNEGSKKSVTLWSLIVVE